MTTPSELFSSLEAHDAPLSGHFGVEKTLEKLKRTWFWPKMAEDVRSYVSSCAICQRTKHSNTKPKGLLHPIIARFPWQIITIDFVEEVFSLLPLLCTICVL